MGFLDWLLGRKDETRKAGGKTTYTEKDNVGTRHDSIEFASAYWMARISSSRKDPYVLYTFDTERAARAALLELPCIHEASDTGEVICTEVLTFGCYQTHEGKWEAIVCGDDLSHELWEQAKAAFARHGGKRKNDLEPEQRARAAPKPKAGGKVVFVREERQEQSGATMVYRIHRAPDAATAKTFLEEHPVSQRFHYIVVETPEGNYCRDVQGMYKE